jgi:proteic killer suppression protein
MRYSVTVAIRSYRDRGTRDIANRINSKAARQTLPVDLHEPARRRLAFLAAAQSLDDLRAWRGLNLHALTGNRRGQHAIRVNDQYRICFIWIKTDADDVEITDYH